MIEIVNAEKLSVEHAQEIANLLNDRNQLMVKYTASAVLMNAKSPNWTFIVELDDENQLMGVIEVLKVQWYQCEIKHLSVDKKFERKGVASRLLLAALDVAKERGASIAQCTIRNDNLASTSVFNKYGFKVTSQFANKVSGNTVNVFQLDLTESEPELKNKYAE